MKAFFQYFKPSLVITIAMLVICGLAYPAVMTGLGQLIFPNQANGSLITAEGEKTQDPDKAAGSALVGQDFSGDARYFQGRVSSIAYNTYTKEQKEAGEYSGPASGSFNYGPSSQALKERAEKGAQDFMESHPYVKEGQIPGDLLTASGSGLDPDISAASAQIQIPSISKETGIPEQELERIVKSNTKEKALGLFGEKRVNVLGCNLDIAERL